MSTIKTKREAEEAEFKNAFNGLPPKEAIDTTDPAGPAERAVEAAALSVDDEEAQRLKKLKAPAEEAKA
jgi:hypothetical protein